MSDMRDPNKTLDAVWCWDSETGKKYLIDRKTNEVIMTEEELDANNGC